jgi:hypothetical protein
VSNRNIAVLTALAKARLRRMQYQPGPLGTLTLN